MLLCTKFLISPLQRSQCQCTRGSLLPSALATRLESELSLPTLPLTLGSQVSHFTDVWRARAEGLCRDSPTPLPMTVETKAGRVISQPSSLTHHLPVHRHPSGLSLPVCQVGNEPHSPNFRMKTGTSWVCKWAHYPIAPKGLKLELVLESPGGLRKEGVCLSPPPPTATLPPGASDSGGLGRAQIICMSYTFSGDAIVAGSGPTL